MFVIWCLHTTDERNTDGHNMEVSRNGIHGINIFMKHGTVGKSSQRGLQQCADIQIDHTSAAHAPCSAAHAPCPLDLCACGVSVAVPLSCLHDMSGGVPCSTARPRCSVQATGAVRCVLSNWWRDGRLGTMVRTLLAGGF